MAEDYKNELFQGYYPIDKYRSYIEYEQDLIKELLCWVREKGLSVNQAQSILKQVMLELPLRSVIVSLGDYEQITGKDPLAYLHKNQD